MDKLEKILRKYLNNGSNRIDVTMVLALIQQFKKDTKEQLTFTDVGCGLDFDKLRKQFDDILDTFDKQKIQDWLDKKS